MSEQVKEGTVIHAERRKKWLDRRSRQQGVQEIKSHVAKIVNAGYDSRSGLTRRTTDTAEAVSDSDAWWQDHGHREKD